MLTTACIDCGRQRAFVTGAESAALAEPLFSECPNGCFAVNLDLGGRLQVFYYYDGQEAIVDSTDLLVPHLRRTNVFSIQCLPPVVPSPNGTLATSDLTGDDIRNPSSSSGEVSGSRGPLLARLVPSNPYGRTWQMGDPFGILTPAEVPDWERQLLQ